jgi:hypothetical protein
VFHSRCHPAPRMILPPRARRARNALGLLALAGGLALAVHGAATDRLPALAGVPRLQTLAAASDAGEILDATLPLQYRDLAALHGDVAATPWTDSLVNSSDVTLPPHRDRNGLR